MINNKIVVSVCCVTYNHESFIKNCLDGFVSQITDFNYEILIHDDASSDNTQSIIKIYEDKYPDKIHGVYQSENQWMKNGRNPLLKILFPIVRGKYVALCEGDDYWTDPYKLQKQVDFLEANKEYSICFHQTKTLYEDGSELWYNDFTENISFDFIDLVQRPFISTVSSVFKNPKSLPDWYNEVPGDWSIFLYMASLGKIYYMSECMAVYRRHSGGIFSSLSNDEKYNNTITLLNKLDKIFNFEYHEYFEKSKQARHAIHYPPVPAVITQSLLGRIKRKIKSLLYLK